jgi:two-component system, sensor histidine kinase
MQSTSAELARSALDAAPDAMIIVDEAGIIRYANRHVSTLFGYPHEGVVGLSVEQLMPERFRNGHVAIRQGYEKAPRLRLMGAGLPLFGRRRDGSEFPVEISLSPIRESARTLVAAAIRDVTERQRAEEELRAARQTSERAREAADHAREAADHLREVADQARESADRANQAKSRFLATASHDLRQPLQTLALLNGSLRRMVIHENAEEALSQQEQAIGAMSRLLNALLDISKLESGAVKPEVADFSVAGLFEGLRREFASIAASKGLVLQVEASEESAFSDPALVDQILKNLVSNAIKYTRQGRVHLRCLRQDASLRLEVLDTGIGIPAEQLAYIYDEFYQVGVPTNSSRDGYGLGLSIVQHLLKLLNLRVEVASEVGRGSVFSLMLPVGKSQHPLTQSQVAMVAAGGTPTRKPRVLLVEDDPAVRDATRMLLRVEGYRVTAVASLSEALRSTREAGAPELLITDYHLREGELGTQVIAAVRASVGAEVKAVLVTGDTSAVIKQMSGDRQLRIASKPINADELLSLLAALLAG